MNDNGGDLAIGVPGNFNPGILKFSIVRASSHDEVPLKMAVRPNGSGSGEIGFIMGYDGAHDILIYQIGDKEESMKEPKAVSSGQMSKEMWELQARVAKAEYNARKNEQAFESTKELLAKIVWLAHWTLRVGIVGIALGVLGWRLAVGAVAALCVDESLRSFRQWIEELKP